MSVKQKRTRRVHRQKRRAVPEGAHKGKFHALDYEEEKHEAVAEEEEEIEAVGKPEAEAETEEEVK